MSPEPCKACSGPHRSDGTIAEDPLYVGPRGHAPPEICYCCWEAAWADACAAMGDLAGTWERPLYAMWLLAGGMTQQEVADTMSVSRSTIVRFRYRIIMHPNIIPAAWIERVRTLAKVRARHRGPEEMI